jgi:hypothetical protein
MKCDKCKKTIKEDGEYVSLGYYGKEFFLPWTKHLCTTCAKPVVAFIKAEGWDKKKQKVV